MEDIRIRHAEPRDYRLIIFVINDWWGGRKMADMLPKLFFVHFHDTGFVAEAQGEVVGFIIGFLSQTQPAEAYIHFVGVHPEFRKRGVARALYDRFFEAVAERGRNVVRCVTSPINQGSIAFHRRLGFAIEPGETEQEGVPVAKDYDGPGADRVLFVKRLDRQPPS